MDVQPLCWELATHEIPQEVSASPGRAAYTPLDAQALFRISPLAPASRLFEAYSQTQGRELCMLRFMHDMVRMNGALSLLDNGVTDEDEARLPESRRPARVFFPLTRAYSIGPVVVASVSEAGRTPANASVGASLAGASYAGVQWLSACCCRALSVTP